MVMYPPERSREAVNKIFGDSLPDIPFDERDNPPSDADADHDQWLNDNVPPHHG